jgi:hypothetical protein
MIGFENLKVGDVVARMLGGRRDSDEIVGIRNYRSNHHM